MNPQSSLMSRRNRLNPRFQRPNIRTAHPLTHLLAILDENKGRHGSHVVLLRDLAHFVDIDLDETHILILFAELADFRGNGPAGSAPGCVEVDHRGAGGDEGLEIDGAVGKGETLVRSSRIGEAAQYAAYLSMSATFPCDIMGVEAVLRAWMIRKTGDG